MRHSIPLKADPKRVRLVSTLLLVHEVSYIFISPLSCYHAYAHAKNCRLPIPTHISFLLLTSEPSPQQRRINNPKKRELVRRYQDQRSYQISIMSDPKKLIILISNGCHDRTQSANQEKALHWFASKKVPHEVCDGMDPEQIERRNKLFAVSGVRGSKC